MNRKYGKLFEGVLTFAPINLIVDDMQVINADEADYLAAGYLPIQYTIKPDDNEWQAVYTEVDGIILQSWVYQGKVHDHENMDALKKVSEKSLSGIPAVHTLPTDAKDGDMCLYSPANIIESGKRIYFDWAEFAKLVDEDDCTSLWFNAKANDVALQFDISTQRNEQCCDFTVNISPHNSCKCLTVYFENGVFMEGASQDGEKETTYSAIHELPKYIDLPDFDYAEQELIGNVPLFYAPYRLMVYRAGEWCNTNELFGTDCTVPEKVKMPDEPLESSLSPNVFYDFGERFSVYIPDLIEGDPNKRNEYMFSFISGETATELTLPSSVQWVNELVVEPNKRYEISIVDNIGLWCAVDLAVTAE